MNAVRTPVRFAMVLVAAALAVAACGTSTEPGAERPPTSVGPESMPSSITITQEGGCVQMGPNCARWTLFGSGRFVLERTSTGERVAEDSIAPAPVRSLFSELAAVDFDSLRSSLGPGRCLGCVDGVDTRIEIRFDDRVEVLDSRDVDFDGAELFDRFDEVIGLMSGEAELPVVTR